VEYTHGIFAAQVEMLKAIYGIHPGEIDFCTFPLFALFGPALGMTCVVPDMDASRPATIDAAKAIAHLKQFQVTNFFGSPAVIRALGRSPVRDVITTLRRVISAGAPANPADLEQFSRLIPPTVDVFTPYGATESLPVANIGCREILSETRSLTEQGRGVCIGRPVAGMSVEIIRISDEAIPEWDESLLAAPGEVGEFVVRGAVVTKRYYGLPEATAKAKIRDARTGETLHRMGDVGYKDDRGRLWFLGRKSHRVVTPAGTLFTEMIEPMFNARIGRAGFRTALVGVSRGGVTWPVLCWQRPDDGDVNDIPSRLRDIAMSSEWTRAIGTFLMVPGPFPVDVRHNSKIFREKLAAWADRKLGRRWTGGPG
jgi:acyl-coenzyme A synthetase/AMP-(fatty) acid ligase